MSKDTRHIGVLLVGELNPYGRNPAYALFCWPRGAAGDRLREIMELGDREYLKYDRVNLCTGKWSAPKARREAKRLKQHEGYQVYVLLGAKVREAFGYAKHEFFDAVRHHGKRFVLLPHPSGRNRVWNDPTAKHRARGLLYRTEVL